MLSCLWGRSAGRYPLNPHVSGLPIESAWPIATMYEEVEKQLMERVPESWCTIKSLVDFHQQKGM